MDARLQQARQRQRDDQCVLRALDAKECEALHMRQRTRRQQKQADAAAAVRQLEDEQRRLRAAMNGRGEVAGGWRTAVGLRRQTWLWVDERAEAEVAASGTGETAEAAVDGTEKRAGVFG